VATVAQARVLRAFGVGRIIVAHGVVDPAAVGWLVAEREHAEIYCWVDSADAVKALSRQVTAAGAESVPVFVELGLPGGRTGARGVRAAAAVAHAVDAEPGVRLAGVTGYEGSYAHTRSADDVAAVRRYLAELVQLARTVEAEIVSAGGSAFPDVVVEEFADLGSAYRKVLRSGAYTAHDHGHYARLSPFPLDPALRVWGVVVSTPASGVAFLNLGKRDISCDLDLPVPLAVLRERDGPARSAERLTVTELNDQHAYLSDPAGEVRVGDWVACGVSHPCTTFDRWGALPVVDDRGRVTDVIRTFF
jgi:D-serine deaminase-like pyridoxal phosphate-dependent protein